MGRGGGLKGRGQRLRPEEAAVATGAHRQLGVGALEGTPPPPRQPRPLPLPAPGGARRAQGASCVGIPRRSGSRGALAPPPLGPRAARPAPLREDGAALSGQCAGPRAWSAGGGLWWWWDPRPRPRAQPLARGRWGGGLRRAGCAPAAESALVGTAAAASGQEGAGTEGQPSDPHAQPAVRALPGSLNSEAGAAGARERG